MKTPKNHEERKGKGIPPVVPGECAGRGRIVAAPDTDQCLNTAQLSSLERSFREWAENTSRADVRSSRQRILLIFLLIRYTGAKLNEVLSLDPLRDIDLGRQLIKFGTPHSDADRSPREVQLSATLSSEIRAMLANPVLSTSREKIFSTDPGFLRRKFYERAEDCGFPKRLGSPEMIRKSRGGELLHNNMPLPAVQMLLGHATPSRTASYLAFTEDEIRLITKRFLERESAMNSSARNVFWGKIQSIRRGDIQSLVVLVTLGGNQIITMITNNSLDRLGLHEGKLTSAEVKAPWVFVQKGENIPECSSENRFQGVITRMTRGKVATEYVIRITDGTELCAIASTESSMRQVLQETNRVWALFNCFSVVLHSDVEL
ncbi:MAG TPA: transporter [Desulfobulbaceae bacterium]|nr:transporter [Desulfobulbaceae bacterium]